MVTTGSNTGNPAGPSTTIKRPDEPFTRAAFMRDLQKVTARTDEEPKKN